MYEFVYLLWQGWRENWISDFTSNIPKEIVGKFMKMLNNFSIPSTWKWNHQPFETTKYVSFTETRKFPRNSKWNIILRKLFLSINCYCFCFLIYLRENKLYFRNFCFVSFSRKLSFALRNFLAICISSLAKNEK